MTALHDWLTLDPRNFDRLYEYTRKAHRGRIGPVVAAFKTAASLAAIGSSTHLDLFAMRAFALALDVELSLHMPKHFQVRNTAA